MWYGRSGGWIIKYVFWNGVFTFALVFTCEKWFIFHYFRLLVAASVGQNPRGDSLTLRHTTLMPNLHGLASLVLLIFAPCIELRYGTCLVHKVHLHFVQVNQRREPTNLFEFISAVLMLLFSLIPIIIFLPVYFSQSLNLACASSSTSPCMLSCRSLWKQIAMYI